jgi:hypothetical protein
MNETNKDVTACLIDLRKAMDDFDKKVASQSGRDVQATDIHNRAALAASAGCGNCGEQAAIAFSYLELSRNARPLDYVGPAGSTRIVSSGNIDHAFVVIGRVKGSDPLDQKTWGVDAVVCDPWDGDSGSYYMASDIPTRFLANSVTDAVGGYCAMTYPFASIYRLD